jgi:hypothetical protein
MPSSRPTQVGASWFLLLYRARGNDVVSVHVPRLRRKLDVLCVECTKCDRKGRYSVARLIEKYGRKGNLMVWREMLNGDCPKRDARIHDRCDLVCPDLPKVL